LRCNPYFADLFLVIPYQYFSIICSIFVYFFLFFSLTFILVYFVFFQFSFCFPLAVFSLYVYSNLCLFSLYPNSTTSLSVSQVSVHIFICVLFSFSCALIFYLTRHLYNTHYFFYFSLYIWKSFLIVLFFSPFFSFFTPIPTFVCLAAFCHPLLSQLFFGALLRCLLKKIGADTSKKRYTSKGQFHQHFTCAFFVRKCFAQLFFVTFSIRNFLSKG